MVTCVCYICCLLLCAWFVSASFKWVGLGYLLVTFNDVGGPLIFSRFKGCVNNPFFSNFRLYSACWARFMCHHEMWPTLVVIHCPLPIALYALMEENITRKLPSLYLGLFFILLYHAALLFLFFYHYLFSFLFVAGLLLQYMALFQSGN